MSHPSQIPLHQIRTEAQQRILDGSADLLNRRVEVEQLLLRVASGKRALLTQDECRVLASKLGVPKL